MLPVKNYSTCSEKEPHAARDSLALSKKNHTKKFSQRQEVTKVHRKGNFSLYLWKRGPLYIGKTTFLLPNTVVEKSTGEMLCICKIEENIIFCRFSLGSRKPRLSGTLKSPAILYIFYAFFCQHHFLYRMCINGYF